MREFKCMFNPELGELTYGYKHGCTDGFEYITVREISLQYDTAVEAMVKALEAAVENMKPSEGDCLTCDNWPDRKQHHKECPYFILNESLKVYREATEGEK